MEGYSINNRITLLKQILLLLLYQKHKLTTQLTIYSVTPVNPRFLNTFEIPPLSLVLH